MQPKPVIARLVTAHHRGPRSKLMRGSLANALEQCQQSHVVAAFELMPRYAVPIRAVQGDQPALLAQFDRNENRANMADGGRVQVGCLHLTSPMVRVVENPNLSGARSPPHGIYARLHRRRPFAAASRSLSFNVFLVVSVVQ